MMDIDIVIAIATYSVSLPESSSLSCSFNSLRRQGEIECVCVFLKSSSHDDF